MKPFSLWFRRQLDAKGMTRGDFARRAGVSARTVTAWYNGERVPDPTSCDIIADVLTLSIDHVLERAGHRPVPDEVDPVKAELLATLERIDLTPEWEVTIREVLAAARRGSEQVTRRPRPAPARSEPPGVGATRR